MIDWRIHWFSNYWLANQLNNNCFTDLLIYWLSKRLTGWLTDWMNAWRACKLTDWMTNWRTNWVTDWQIEQTDRQSGTTDWLIDWPSDCLTNCLSTRRYMELINREPMKRVISSLSLDLYFFVFYSKHLDVAFGAMQPKTFRRPDSWPDKHLYNFLHSNINQKCNQKAIAVSLLSFSRWK